MGSIPVTHTMAQDQRRAMTQARATQDQQNHGATTIETQDVGKEAGYVIYVYNILDRDAPRDRSSASRFCQLS